METSGSIRGLASRLAGSAVEGMEQAGITQLSTCASTLPMYAEKYPNIAPKDLMQKLCLDNKSTDFDGITMGQFVDGMDQFYRDFRNKQLYMTWAIEYVRDQLKGKSADDLSVELTTCGIVPEPRPLVTAVKLLRRALPRKKRRRSSLYGGSWFYTRPS
jgi:hypothetical protein